MRTFAATCLVMLMITSSEAGPCSTNENCGKCCPIGYNVFGDGNGCQALTDSTQQCGLCGNQQLRQCRTTEQPTVTITMPGETTGVSHSTSGGSRKLRFTIWKENIPAWLSLPGSLFHKIPEFMDGVMATIPEHKMSAGTEVAWSCPAQNAGVCDAYVFQYKCGVCPFENGALPAFLLSLNQGWTPSRCAPRFKLSAAAAVSHNMMSFRTQVQPGQTIKFTIPNLTEFLAFAFAPNGVDCGAFTGQATCEDSSLKGICAWDAATLECRSNYCPINPTTPLGPNLPCAPCVY